MPEVNAVANDEDIFKTFADLDRTLGLSELPCADESEFLLPAWYRSVWLTPLCELSIGDLCRSCEQSIHLRQIVPLAIAALEREPLAGEWYEGQLISSILAIPPQFWLENRAVAEVCYRVARSLPDTDDLEFQENIRLLLERTAPIRDVIGVWSLTQPR